MNRSVTGAPYNIKVTVCHTASHYGEEYIDWNSAVFFRLRRNCNSDGAKRTDGGRTLHARAAATGKARSPSVVCRMDGITSTDVEHSEDTNMNLCRQSGGGSQRGMMTPCH